MHAQPYMLRDALPAPAGDFCDVVCCMLHDAPPPPPPVLRVQMRLVRGLLLTSASDAEAEQHASTHERALWNSVLGTQRGDRPGEMLYWLPLGAGVSKADLKHPHHTDGQQHGWSLPHGDFWCCVGSGIEAFARLGDSTFFRLAAPTVATPNVATPDVASASSAGNGDGSAGEVVVPPARASPVLYVMQLVSSTLSWQEAGLRITLTVDEPGTLPADRSLRLRLQVSTLAATVATTAPAPACTVRLRIPRWAFVAPSGGAHGRAEPPRARLITASGTAELPPAAILVAADGENGEGATMDGGEDATTGGGGGGEGGGGSGEGGGAMLEVSRAWHDDDALTLSLPMALRTEPIADTRPQYRGLVALLCGPLLLAGLTRGARTILADPSALGTWLQPVPPSANAQLRSLVVGSRTDSRVLSASARGPRVSTGPLPASSSADAPEATWRLLCHPRPELCTHVALESYAQPGAYLGLARATARAAAQNTSLPSAPAPVITLITPAGGPAAAPPEEALYKVDVSGSSGSSGSGGSGGGGGDSGGGDGSSGSGGGGRDGSGGGGGGDATSSVSPLGLSSFDALHLAPKVAPDSLMCADDASSSTTTTSSRLLLRPRASTAAGTAACRFRLVPPAARYPPLSMWARPSSRGRGFLFVPLKEVIDEVYSVYFYVGADASAVPRECSSLREPWSEEGDGADDSVDAASRALAQKVLAASEGRWGRIKGLAFESRGVLRTPWGSGRWGVLPERPGELFADFGGARHELTFDAWPAFTSVRCSDGEVVHGSVAVGSG